MILFRKFIIFTLIFSIYLSTAYAISFDASATPINDKIAIDEVATFQINIKNNLGQKDEYRIYSLNFPTWDVRTDPIENPITLELNPGEEGSVEIVVDPLKIREIGTYQININVRSKAKNQLLSVPLKVSIMSTDTLIQGYVPTVITSIGIKEKIDPREEIPIKIVLNNQNIIDYPELIIKLESNLIKDTLITKLGPKEVKTLELTASLDPLTEPQEDRLVVTLFVGERSINSITRKIDIIEYAEPELVSEEKKLLLTRINYNFISNNKEYEDTFKIETTLLASIFSSTNPKAKIVKENGKRYFVFDVTLQNNTMQVIVTKNFIPLVAVIILLVIAGAAYYMLRSPLVIMKDAKNIVKKEGGISEMTVVMHIKNRGKDKIGEIDVTEYIHALVSVGSDVPIGSLKPVKVLKHEKEGSTIVKWKVDHLDPSEERILSYKIKSRLSILGSFSLPPTKATFLYNKKPFTSSSNRLSVGN